MNFELTNNMWSPHCGLQVGKITAARNRLVPLPIIWSSNNNTYVRDVNPLGDFRLELKGGGGEARRIPEAEDPFASLRFRFFGWKFAEGEFFRRVLRIVFSKNFGGWRFLTMIYGCFSEISGRARPKQLRRNRCKWRQVPKRAPSTRDVLPSHDNQPRRYQQLCRQCFSRSFSRRLFANRQSKAHRKWTIPCRDPEILLSERLEDATDQRKAFLSGGQPLSPSDPHSTISIDQLNQKKHGQQSRPWSRDPLPKKP
uniref:Uncharacterized protein n=1 Tax=Oikopleura dioica TaxID=34765 RepID=Q66S40_OIKDI|nr:hypothetical protein 008-17 [Oikopleura dioica]